MKMLTEKEIKDELLYMLKWFDGFCENNDLNYSLGYGTLIGAIRHKDFIPWDDDVDVVMLRKDYEKMCSLLPEIERSGKYSLTCLKNGTTDYPFAKFVNKAIKVKQQYIEGNDDYLWIDIFPLDGVPDKKSERMKIFKKARHYRSMVERTKFDITDVVGRKDWKSTIKGLLHPILNVFGVSFFSERLDLLAKKIKYEDSALIANIVWGYGESGTIEKCKFERTCSVDFRGNKFKAMSCWDEFLSNSYGDYMKFPDESHRVSHGLKAYRTE